MVDGETVPMPPVFGPWSPSRARLWSWTETMGTTRAPSEKTRNETSSPVTVFTTSGPVMNMYDEPSAISVKSVIAGE